MAAAVQPSGLMDIASSLTQDEIPFKLRCAICNKLAVNAFKLPCCDQAICENCQASLPDTCPVCAHTPLSSDLCKPNKALRTTLKAFLRTEEKKREKERQAATPATPDVAALAEETPVAQDAQEESKTVEGALADGITPSPAEPSSEEKLADTATLAAEANEPSAEQEDTSGISQDEPAVTSQDQPPNAEQNEAAEGETAGGNEVAEQSQQDTSQNAMSDAGFPNAMGFGMNPGMFPNMAWGANPMAQFMGNGMMGFPNPMVMSGMGMDPMAANQGMFGGFGMNMNGMNMGMSFNGQGMYGGWDGSQNNMWNGSQDKFNPNAFPNAIGAQLGDPSGFGGYNMSQQNGVHPQMQQQQQQYPNQEFQNGYYGTGNYRGRGRGHYSGRGRGGYGSHMQSNFPHNANNTAEDAGSSSMDQNGQPQNEEGATAPDGGMSTEGNKGGNTAEGPEDSKDLASKDPNDQPNGNLESGPGTDGVPGQALNQDQLQGIPTIDSLGQSEAAFNMGMGTGIPLNMNQDFGRDSGYMRGGIHGHGRGASFSGQQFMQPNGMQPRGPVVEGAPAAPRAMRQGLPNTSVFRQRSFQPGRGSRPSARGTEASETPQSESIQEDQNLQSASRSISRARSKSRSRSRSPPPQSRSNSRRRYRQRSRSLEKDGEDYDRERDRYKSSRRDEKDRLPAEDEARTRSPSLESHRSSRRDEGRSRHSRRSRRSRRHRSSRSASASRRGDREDDRLASIAEERSDSKARSRNTEPRSSRREETRDRDRERDRDSRRRDRDRNRNRDRDRHREKERERDRDRDRPRDRERDRKRSRRDRSESAVDDDHYSRRTKRGREDDVRSSRDRTRDTRGKALPSSKPSEPEKDPHTLEREARNHERMLKEQQRREAMHTDSGKPSRRRDSRQERGGRRLNYKYDDESDAARADRVEREREANRWD
ncbi:hypothetical protein BDV06DRAFT_5432 [Aspergillus oleicola]